MKSLKIPCFLGLFFLISFSGFSQDCDLASVVQVDGKADEWNMEWIKDEKFYYNACSDAVNLYIRVKCDDDVARRKMGIYGFTVWLDPNGKKKRKLGLRFPSGVEGAERLEVLREEAEKKSQQRSSGERIDYQREVNRRLIEDLEIMELIGLSDDPITSTRSGITNGMKVAIATDDGITYVYEAIIPFKSFRLSKASIDELGIGFETGKYNPPKVNSANKDPKKQPQQKYVPSVMQYTDDIWFVLKTK